MFRKGLEEGKVHYFLFTLNTYLPETQNQMLRPKTDSTVSYGWAVVEQKLNEEEEK